MTDRFSSSPSLFSIESDPGTVPVSPPASLRFRGETLSSTRLQIGVICEICGSIFRAKAALGLIRGSACQEVADFREQLLLDRGRRRGRRFLPFAHQPAQELDDEKKESGGDDQKCH